MLRFSKFEAPFSFTTANTACSLYSGYIFEQTKVNQKGGVIKHRQGASYGFGKKNPNDVNSHPKHK
jgi:hypothetical protein